MRRPPLPSVIGDLLVDRRAASALLASAVALFAAGMDPKVMAPMATTTQAALREKPELEGLVLLLSVITATFLLVGGAVGDLSRARPIVLGGLVISLVAAIIAIPLLGSQDFTFRLVRLIGIASAAILMPSALAMAAVSYTGVNRATAIGLAYAGYGAGQAVSPTLVSFIPGQPLPAFIGSIAACALALFVVRNRIPEIPRASAPERPLVIGTALWAIGVVLVTIGVLWFGGGWDNPLRLSVIGIGVALIVSFAIASRRRRSGEESAVRVDRKPVTIALFVGLVIAAAQTVPASQMPLFFGVVMRYGPLLGVVALAPLFAGLILAGPIAGFLLARYQPRHLIAGGVMLVGLGDLATALVLGRGTPYLLFILPLLVVGGGFVVATTVRTAIIFASVPRGLPATAAALNEASIEVGMRAGIVIITAVLADLTVRIYSSSQTGLPADQLANAVDGLRSLMGVLGLPNFQAAAAAVQPGELQLYGESFVQALRIVLMGGGLLGVVGGLITWFALGRRDPLATVYEFGEERRGEAPTA
jgi:MFS family permease